MIDGRCEEPGTGDEQQRAVREIVAAVEGHGLGAVALFVLEVIRPVHLLVQQVFLTASPLLDPWLGNRLSLWAGLLQDTDVLEQVSRLLADQRPEAA